MKLRALCRLQVGPRGGRRIEVDETFESTSIGWLDADVALATARKQVVAVVAAKPSPSKRAKPLPEPVESTK